MHGGDGISNQPSRMPASSPRQQMVEGRLDVTLSLHLSAYQPTCRYVMRLACLKPWSCNPSCCKGALGPNMPKRTGIPRRTNNCRARSVGLVPTRLRSDGRRAVCASGVRMVASSAALAGCRSSGLVGSAGGSKQSDRLSPTRQYRSRNTGSIGADGPAPFNRNADAAESYLRRVPNLQRDKAGRV
jgi:hypothetical protein